MHFVFCVRGVAVAPVEQAGQRNGGLCEVHLFSPCQSMVPVFLVHRTGSLL